MNWRWVVSAEQRLLAWSLRGDFPFTRAMLLVFGVHLRETVSNFQNDLGIAQRSPIAMRTPHNVGSAPS